MKKLVVDIDGTLCEQCPYELYSAANPIKPMIDKINRLFDDGWEIVLFTSRGMNYNKDPKEADEYFRDITEEWLIRHGVKYHTLLYGKPTATYYIDDKAMKPEEFLDTEL
jgi:capsule biosynthesis phosphatase